MHEKNPLESIPTTSQPLAATHLADHMLGRVVLEPEPLRERVRLAADRPLGDVVRPLERRQRGGRIAVLRIEAAHRAADAAARARLARRPLLPRRYRLGRPQAAHRALRLRALHAARVVVADAARRLALLPPHPADPVPHAAVAPHARRKLGAQMHQVVAARPNPDVARLVVLHLLQTERGDQHLAGLLLHADADRADAVADQRDEQHEHLRGRESERFGGIERAMGIAFGDV